jgi:hypothetical protein
VGSPHNPGKKASEPRFIYGLAASSSTEYPDDNFHIFGSLKAFTDIMETPSESGPPHLRRGEMIPGTEDMNEEDYDIPPTGEGGFMCVCKALGLRVTH